jgi:hypothetical protein
MSTASRITTFDRSTIRNVTSRPTIAKKTSPCSSKQVAVRCSLGNPSVQKCRCWTVDRQRRPDIQRSLRPSWTMCGTGDSERR